jgi:LysR family transcriptional activator of nhaA
MKIDINGKKVWINFHHLYCFYVIASEGSLASASKRLNIGQSALSIQLKQFERSIGEPLFERSHRKLSLNEGGRLVFSYAKEIFRIGGEMIETLNDKTTSGRIRLQLGALDTIPKHLTLELTQFALQGDGIESSELESNPPRSRFIVEGLDHLSAYSKNFFGV